MQRTFVRIVWCTLLLFPSLLSLHAEDYWQDTLWIRKIPLGGHFFSKILFHPDGKSIFVTSDHYLFRYDVQTGNIISTFEMKEKGYIRDYEISRDEKNLIIITDIRNNGNIPCFEEWNIETGYVRHYRYDNIKSDGQTASLAMGKNDSLLYVGCEINTGYLYIIDFKTGKYLETKKDVGKYLDITTDGKYMVSAFVNESSNGICKLIDMDTWETTAIFSKVYEPKFSPDGRFFAGRSESENIILYDLENKKGYILRGHKGRVQDVCFMSDNKHLVSAANGESVKDPSKGGYRIWDLISKKQVFEAPYFTGTSGYMTVDANMKYYGRLNGNYELTMWKFNNPIANSIVEKTEETEIRIIPNPTQSYIELTIPPNCHNGVLSITDIKGKEILRQNLVTDTQQEQKTIIDISLYHNGHYYLRIETSSHTYSSSFIINR